MKRAEFIRVCGIFGLSLPLQASLIGCNDDDEDPVAMDFNGTVLILGAGAAGMSAGYLLGQQGINYRILEASDTYGGRMKRTTDFANFPIPLGAEWIHVPPAILNEIVNDSSVQVDINTTPYDQDNDEALFNGEPVTMADIGFSIDEKFINATWFDFYEQYIYPAVQDKITYNTVVDSIDYSGNTIRVVAGSETFEADRVIVSIPPKILQNGAVNFTPALPANKQDALQKIKVWDGCKAFIEFSEDFYPVAFANDDVSENDGQKLYYDAAYGQNTSQHVLGLFAVGDPATALNNMTDQERIDFMLAELDAQFDNKASAAYIKHIFQNWNAEPYANGAYVWDNENWQRVRTLGQSVNDKVYFAGCSYTQGEDWSSVHTAARSAARAVSELVEA